MHEEQLKGMYEKAGKVKLIEMWGRAESYESKASVLESKARSITDNIIKVVSSKFEGEKGKEIHKIGELQLSEMCKQWRLMSASMVKVKRTIRLPGFHSKLNLCVNSRYGIKEHKRYSGWQPFHIYDLKRMSGSDSPPYEIAGSFLRSSDKRIDFAQLDNIPQLDPERVEMLAGLTHDIVQMLNSWIEFFGSENKNFMNDYELVLKLADKYNRIGHDEWPGIINRLEKLEKVRDTIQGKLEAQANKWKPTLEKWQARNKNFVVLNELAKSDLRI